MKRTQQLSLGIDYGTDSARALLVDVDTGEEVAADVAKYPRWSTGDFCDAGRQQYRQHPRDHLEAMTKAVRGAMKRAGRGAGDRVVGMGVDTTGSTPIAVDAQGTALALRPEFAKNPNAMFVLWKDHTAIAEAEEINQLSHGGRFEDFTRFCGGIYSSEWYWAKAAHVSREDAAVAKAAASWVEHCDWLPAVLTGTTALDRISRSRCAAGHKALWHAEWDGLPSEAFLAALEPRLKGQRARYSASTATCDQKVGGLTGHWAKILGLRAGIPVAAGAFDAHLGAVGAGASPFVLAKVMGTSTCDMMVAPNDSVRGTVRGICGQVDGSILPGMLGLEAGQSAFGDVYAWFGRLLSWPRENNADLASLEKSAKNLPPAGKVLAVDWFNGRRTPDADQRLRGAITGLDLSSDAPTLYRALVEATAYGARAIIDRFVEQGVPVKSVLALGGVARKSPFILQTCADVFARPIAVVASDQCCALGAAIAGAVAAGCFPSVGAAQKTMASRVEKTYRPQKAAARAYEAGYARYRSLGAHLEADVASKKQKAAK